MADHQENQIKACAAAVQTLEDTSQELDFQEGMAARIFEEMFFCYKKDSVFCKSVSQLQQSLCEARAYRHKLMTEQREEMEKTLIKIKREQSAKEEKYGH